MSFQKKSRFCPQLTDELLHATLLISSWSFKADIYKLVWEITLLSVMRECNDIADILFNWI
jgi:hypothetical protein